MWKGFIAVMNPQKITAVPFSSVAFYSDFQLIVLIDFDCFEAHNFIVLVQSLRFHCIGSTQQADVLSEKALKPHVAAQQLTTNGPHKVSDIF